MEIGILRDACTDIQRSLRENGESLIADRTLSPAQKESVQKIIRDVLVDTFDGGKASSLNEKYKFNSLKAEAGENAKPILIKRLLESALSEAKGGAVGVDNRHNAIQRIFNGIFERDSIPAPGESAAGAARSRRSSSGGKAGRGPTPPITPPSTRDRGSSRAEGAASSPARASTLTREETYALRNLPKVRDELKRTIEDMTPLHGVSLEHKEALLTKLDALGSDREVLSLLHETRYIERASHRDITSKGLLNPLMARHIIGQLANSLEKSPEETRQIRDCVIDQLTARSVEDPRNFDKSSPSFDVLAKITSVTNPPTQLDLIEAVNEKIKRIHPEGSEEHRSMKDAFDFALKQAARMVKEGRLNIRQAHSALFDEIKVRLPDPDLARVSELLGIVGDRQSTQLITNYLFSIKPPRSPG